MNFIIVGGLVERENTVKPLYKNMLGITNYILMEEVFLYKGNSWLLKKTGPAAIFLLVRYSYIQV